MSLKSGCEGISAINTIMSVMGIDLKTLHPEPCVEGLAIAFLHCQRFLKQLLLNVVTVFAVTRLQEGTLTRLLGLLRSQKL